MDILLVMCLGIAAGRFVIPAHARRLNESLSLLCTFALIFAMGIMLGKKENFLTELSSLGLISFLFFLIPTLLSILLVFFLTKRFMKDKSSEKQEELKK